MSEIICPRCKEDLRIDEASYADIVKQVRDSELEAEVMELKAVQQRTLSEIEKSLEELHAELLEKDAVIAELRAEYEIASA
jgi:hypothetical protein